MQFQNPEFFYLFILVPFIFIYIIVNSKKKNKIILKYFLKKNFKKVAVKRKKSKIYFKNLILLTVFSLIVFALSKPQYGYKEIALSKNKGNIFIALDVSLSMRAQDVKPSRIEFAKRKIIDFLNNLNGENVTLICFAGVPFVNIPLTSDYSIFKDYMNIIDTDLIPVQGTNFYNLINKIVEIAKRKNLNGAEVLILSDGENFSGNIDTALKLCKKFNIKIFALGIGKSKPVPIKLKDGSLKKDKNGKIVMTKLDEDFLKKISIETGGIYIKAVNSTEDVNVLYKTMIKISFVKGKLKKRVYINRFQWFIIPAFILLCLYFVIDERKSKVVIILLFIIFYNLNLNAANPSILNNEGVKLYKEKKINKALEYFNKAYEIDKKNIFLYNKALSLFKLGKYKEALKIFNNLKQSEKVFYNKGVIHYKLKDYKSALNDFKHALKLNPDDIQARINYELTLQKLKSNKQNNKRNKNKNNKKKEKRKKKNNNLRSNMKNHQIHKNKKELQKLLNLYNENPDFLKQIIRRKLKRKAQQNQKDW